MYGIRQHDDINPLRNQDTLCLLMRFLQYIFVHLNMFSIKLPILLFILLYVCLMISNAFLHLLWELLCDLLLDVVLSLITCDWWFQRFITSLIVWDFSFLTVPIGYEWAKCTNLRDSFLILDFWWEIFPKHCFFDRVFILIFIVVLFRLLMFFLSLLSRLI